MKVFYGDIFVDDRGVLKSVNNFDLSSVVRMYSIEPKLGVIRAWQGHKQEKKWFHVVAGRFLVKTMNMKTLRVNEYELSSLKPTVIEISGGNYNGFQALESGSILMVYSDFDLQSSKIDDYRLSIEQYPW